MREFSFVVLCFVLFIMVDFSPRGWTEQREDHDKHGTYVHTGENE